MLRHFTTTLLAAICGGCVFFALNIPIPWMLGPLVFINILNFCFKQAVYWPINVRNGGMVVLGCIMGSSFTMETLHEISHQLPTMLFATVSITCFSMFLGYIIHLRTNTGLASSILGSVPGGLSQMTLLSEEIPHCDTTVVTFLQTIRLLSVVFIVPFIAVHGLANAAAKTAARFSLLPDFVLAPGYFASLAIGLSCAASFALIAQRLRFPTPFLLGPILGIAALSLSGLPIPPLPPIITIAAQLAVGGYMGATTRPASLKNWKIVLPYALAGGIGTVLFSLLVGVIISYFLGIDPLTAFLSTAPGGMTEMGVTAINTHAAISTVTAYQIFRLLFLLLILPLLLKRWLRG